jgi:hypothetical protein
LHILRILLHFGRLKLPGLLSSRIFGFGPSVPVRKPCQGVVSFTPSFLFLIDFEVTRKGIIAAFQVGEANIVDHV